MAASSCAIPTGGPVNASPSGAKRITGGRLPLAASANGSITHCGSRCIGTDAVSPFAVRCQITRRSGSPPGIRMVKTPQARPGVKRVGCPWSGGPGST